MRYWPKRTSKLKLSQIAMMKLLLRHLTRSNHHCPTRIATKLKLNQRILRLQILNLFLRKVIHLKTYFPSKSNCHKTLHHFSRKTSIFQNLKIPRNLVLSFQMAGGNAVAAVITILKGERLALDVRRHILNLIFKESHNICS